MRIFSIVVIFNGMNRDWIKKCFTSLQNSTYNTVIIAIDNGSSDESVNFIKRQFPSVILIESNENLGFGRANNLGINYAVNKNATYVFLLNQDAWIQSDTIEKLVVELEKNPKYGIISPLHLTGNGKFLDLSFSKSISPQYCKNLYSDFVLNQNFNKVYESHFICAAAWLISKNCLQKIGGFNPTFFHYGEDDNFVHRLHFKSLKLGVLPTCRIYHDREERSTNVAFENNYYLERNKYLLNVSNPDLKLSVDDVLRHLRIVLIKTYFNFNLKQRTDTKKLLRFFKENKKEIDNNLDISKKDFFPFLEINNV